MGQSMTIGQEDGLNDEMNLEGKVIETRSARAGTAEKSKVDAIAKKNAEIFPACGWKLAVPYYDPDRGLDGQDGSKHVRFDKDGIEIRSKYGFEYAVLSETNSIVLPYWLAQEDTERKYVDRLYFSTELRGAELAERAMQPCPSPYCADMYYSDTEPPSDRKARYLQIAEKIECEEEAKMAANPAYRLKFVEYQRSKGFAVASGRQVGWAADGQVQGGAS